MATRFPGLALVVVSVLAARSAVAETKSWAALKAKLPSSTAVVVGIDVKAMRGTSSLPTLAAAVLAEAKAAREIVGLFKTVCAIDAPSVVSDVSIAADLKGEAVIVLGLDGIDEPKIVACANKILRKHDPKAKLTAKPGQFAEYSVTGHRDKLYAVWLAKDVVAFSAKIENRAPLDAMLGGNPAAGDLATFLGKANTATLVWAAAALTNDGVKGGHVSLTLAKGAISFAGTLTAANATTGAKLLKEGQHELTTAIGKADLKAPPVAKVLRAVKLVGSGTEISIAASVSEAELPALLPALDKVF